MINHCSCSLSVNDQAILSPSLELLSRLLSLFGDQCINWRKEKVNALLGKLFLMLESTKLITVKSYIIEVLSKLCQVFTSLFVDHMIDNSSRLLILFNHVFRYNTDMD